MKKLSPKQKKLNQNKAQKQIKRLRKNNKRKRRGCSGNMNSTSSRAKRIHTLCAPAYLSILDDKEQVALEYFDNAIKTIRKCVIGENIYFNFEEVISISADAIMYVIALIRNYKRINILKIRVEGNLPRDAEARKFMEDVGFYSYVSGLKETHAHSKDRFKISQGERPDGILAGNLCDFVIEKNNKEICITKRLYPMIIELMTNTCQHAYKKDDTAKMKSNWYIFAERTDELIHFVFLDTGLGIPATIRRTLFEKGINMVGKKDASFITSALRGENRTETRQRHRGKGLPGIYQDAQNSKISNLSIISGKGKCKVLKNGDIFEETLDYTFEGTLFSWDFRIA